MLSSIYGPFPVSFIKVSLSQMLLTFIYKNHLKYANISTRRPSYEPINQ